MFLSESKSWIGWIKRFFKTGKNLTAKIIDVCCDLNALKNQNSFVLPKMFVLKKSIILLSVFTAVLGRPQNSEKVNKNKVLICYKKQK
jgi:hypothetical protein